MADNTPSSQPTQSRHEFFRHDPVFIPGLGNGFVIGEPDKTGMLWVRITDPSSATGFKDVQVDGARVQRPQIGKGA